jgi:hypothetical protein
MWRAKVSNTFHTAGWLSFVEVDAPGKSFYCTAVPVVRALVVPGPGTVYVYIQVYIYEFIYYSMEKRIIEFCLFLV